MGELPQRKLLPHGIPPWVEPGSVFFITICGEPRGVNQFCLPDVSKSLFDSVGVYEKQQKWWVRLLVLMPDHLHALIAFPRNVSMKDTVVKWKHFHANRTGIRWQRDFFDHRLRKEESLQEKGEGHGIAFL